jgi:hypothetical protein
MGLFSNLFWFGSRRRIETLMNPLLGMRLREFVIVDDHPSCTKHYFRFDNKDGKVEEFVVIYQRFDRDLQYLRTHWKRVGHALEFRTLSDENSPWSISISYLIELGKKHSATTPPTKGHFISKVSTEDLLDPDWVPPNANLTIDREIPSQAAQPNKTAQPPQINNDVAKASVKFTEWQRRGDTLVRSYEFSGMPSPEKTAYLRIECYVTRYLNGNLGTYLRFLLRPYLYLMPNRQPFEDHLTTAPFVVCLFAAGSGAGTEADPLLRGGNVQGKRLLY